MARKTEIVKYYLEEGGKRYEVTMEYLTDSEVLVRYVHINFAVWVHPWRLIRVVSKY